MSCRIGGTFLTPILAIAGLVAAGTVGYKMLGGCSTCTDQDAKAAVVNVANDHGDCSLCTDHKECDSVAASKAEGCSDAKTECGASKEAALTTVAAEGKTECCMSKEAAVKTVAAEGKTECCMSKEAAVKTVAAEAKKEGCCSSEAKTEKVCKEGTDGCTGDGKDGCCGGCEGEKKAEKKEGAQ